jgi:tetratricopeptide (TPR) repeat protein
MKPLAALVLVLASLPAIAQDHGAGIAVLASEVDEGTKSDALAAFVEKGRFSDVLIDWAWITFHWGVTDFRAVEAFVKRMEKAGVRTAAMYRPRFFAREEKEVGVPMQLDTAGNAIGGDHGREICFSSAKARAWGAKWAAEILKKCPSFGEIVVYNPRNGCQCRDCAAGGADAAKTFLRETRAGMQAVRKDAKLGVVAVPGMFEAFGDAVDVARPYVFVDETADFGADADAARLVLASAKEAGPALAKITWAADFKVSDARLAEFVAVARKRELKFVFWTYDDAFLNAKYDFDRLCRALDLDPKPLRELVPLLGGTLKAPAQEHETWLEAQSWAPTAETALERAKTAKRMVMAFLIPYERGAFEAGYEAARDVVATEPLGANETPEDARRQDTGAVKELGILTALFGEPRLAALISKRFIPVRLRMYTRHWYAKGNSPLVDPLKLFGTSCDELRGPAIVFVSPEGKVVHAVPAMGVFSATRLHRLCRALLTAHPEWNAPDAAPKDRLAHVEALIDAGDFDRARARLGEKPPLPAGPILLGEMLLLEEKPDEAEKSLRAAPGTGDLEILRASLLGDALVRLGRFDDARKLLSDAVLERTDEPGLGRAEYVLGIARDALDQRADAEVAWNKVVKREPASAWGARASLRLSKLGPDLAEWDTTRPLAADLFLQGTESPFGNDAVPAAVDYLLRRQRPDGSWREPSRHPLTNDALGLDMAWPRSALATSAMRAWAPALDARRGKAAKEAGARGVGFVRDWAIPDEPSVFSLTYVLQLELELHAAKDKAAAGRIKKLLEGAARTVKAGGWTYMSEKRVHTFNTAPILLLLADAKAKGFAIPNKLLADAAAFLEKNRVGDFAVFHYGTSMTHLTSEDRPEGSSMRGPVCELALLASGGKKSPRLKESVDLFVKHLDDVRATTKRWESFFDATVLHDAYHWAWGCYYGALAIRALEPAARATPAKALREHILSHQEIDGSFADAQIQGKCASTALALMALEALDRK